MAWPSPHLVFPSRASFPGSVSPSFLIPSASCPHGPRTGHLPLLKPFSLTHPPLPSPQARASEGLLPPHPCPLHLMLEARPLQGAPHHIWCHVLWQPGAAAAAAKLLQSCPTLCDPIDGSPRGSPIPEILQARTLEWVAIAFSKATR